MNTLLSLESLGKFALLLQIKSFVLAGIILLGILLFQKKWSAARLHMLWSLTSLMLLCLPFFSAILPSWSITFPSDLPKQPQPVAAQTFSLSSDNFPQNTQKNIEPTFPDIPLATPVSTSGEKQLQEKSLHLFSWIGGIWIAGVILLSLHFLLGRFQLRRIQRKSYYAHETLLSLAHQLQQELGLEKAVPVLQSHQVEIPLTYGTFSPVILLPANVHTLSHEQQHLILSHELAHIQRGDAWTVLLTRLALILYWINPLLWIGQKKNAQWREQACDDFIVAQHNKPAIQNYALLLLDYAKLSSSFPGNSSAILMASSHNIDHRIKTLMNTHINRKKDTKTKALLWGCFITILALPLACVKEKTEDKDLKDQASTLRKGRLHETRHQDYDQSDLTPEMIAELKAETKKHREVAQKLKALGINAHTGCMENDPTGLIKNLGINPQEREKYLALQEKIDKLLAALPESERNKAYEFLQKLFFDTSIENKGEVSEELFAASKEISRFKVLYDRINYLGDIPTHPFSNEQQKQALELLRDLKGIHSLTIDGSLLLENLPELRDLEILCTNADEFLCSDFSFLNKHPNLKHLALNYTNGSSLDANAILSLSKLTQLECLTLCNSFPKESLASLENLQNLKILDIRIADGGGLKSLSQLENLEKLYFSDSEGTITDEDLSHLANLKNLKTFALRSMSSEIHSNIQGSGLSQLKNLQELSIRGTSLNSCISNISQLPLEKLDIGYPTYLTDSNLAELSQMKSLKTMTLSNFRTRHLLDENKKLEIMQKLKQTLPHVEIKEMKSPF